ncbi:hypothetical protein HYH03_017761 [Edaphochlamys debaryana]|uniref:Uncharacterized protein n=1 Tax=Edaphochlamys debaryana TaxID=47281 RepID=A0A835XF26_9CHLO|nr:hypothetical protein HYH03_017761 [Edaphochlamys debaryana]|eukprot:KAG2483362.1 hypothetical protein HYH03_017761 [Edaphochlamys debaryana]
MGRANPVSPADPQQLRLRGREALLSRLLSHPHLVQSYAVALTQTSAEGGDTGAGREELGRTLEPTASPLLRLDDGGSVGALSFSATFATEHATRPQAEDAPGAAGPGRAQPGPSAHGAPQQSQGGGADDAGSGAGGPGYPGSGPARAAPPELAAAAGAGLKRLMMSPRSQSDPGASAERFLGEWRRWGRPPAVSSPWWVMMELCERGTLLDLIQQRHAEAAAAAGAAAAADEALDARAAAICRRWASSALSSSSLVRPYLALMDSAPELGLLNCQDCVDPPPPPPLAAAAAAPSTLAPAAPNAVRSSSAPLQLGLWGAADGALPANVLLKGVADAPVSRRSLGPIAAVALPSGGYICNASGWAVV